MNLLTPVTIPGNHNKNTFFKNFEEVSRRALLTQGELLPTCAVLTSTNKMVLMLLDFNDSHSKSLSMFASEKLCEMSGAVMYCFASEAWMTLVNVEDKETIGLVNEIGVEMLSDKKECLLMTFETIESSKVEQAQIQILRDENNKISLGEEYRTTEAIGRMLNILNKRSN